MILLLLNVIFHRLNKSRVSERNIRTSNTKNRVSVRNSILKHFYSNSKRTPGHDGTFEWPRFQFAQTKSPRKTLLLNVSEVDGSVIDYSGFNIVQIVEVDLNCKFYSFFVFVWLNRVHKLRNIAKHRILHRNGYFYFVILKYSSSLSIYFVCCP